MILSEALDKALMERDLTKITEGQYRKAIAEFSQFIGHPATVQDLEYSRINQWLKSMKGRLEPVTIVNRKKGLTVVWNYLAELGKVEHYHSRRLFCPAVKPRPVVSWTLDDFDLLVAAAKNVTGSYHEIPNADMLRAWLWVGLDTAFRPSDMRRITWDSVCWDVGSITICQSKTKNVHRACISAESMLALQAIQQPVRQLVFPITRDEIRYPLKKLYAEAAKLGFRKTAGRSIGTLRRTHATLQYEDYGASVAAESLGHVGGIRTVLRSYVDHRSRKQGRLPRHANRDSEKGSDSAGAGKVPADTSKPSNCGD